MISLVDIVMFVARCVLLRIAAENVDHFDVVFSFWEAAEVSVAVLTTLGVPGPTGLVLPGDGAGYRVEYLHFDNDLDWGAPARYYLEYMPGPACPCPLEEPEEDVEHWQDDDHQEPLPWVPLPMDMAGFFAGDDGYGSDLERPPIDGEGIADVVVGIIADAGGDENDDEVAVILGE